PPRAAGVVWASAWSVQPASRSRRDLTILAPRTWRGSGLEALVQVLDRGSLGLRPPLQLRKALADRVRRLGDRLEPRVEPLDLFRDVVVDHEVRTDRDEPLGHVLPLRRDEP